jgi:aldose 1-epimerase
MQHPPSGEQYEIAHGQQRVVVTEVGAALRRYAVGEWSLLDGFDRHERCPDGCGQVLAPWPGPLGGSTYCFEGTVARVALDDPERRLALDGLVRWLPWRLASRAQNVVVMRCPLAPQPAYPWRIDLEVEYRLTRDGLVVSTRAWVLEEAVAPFAVGFRPCLAVGTPSVDEIRLAVPARRRLVTDERGLPESEAEVSGGELDFRVPRPVGPAVLDTVFGGLARDRDGIARVRLEHPEDGRALTVWFDAGFPFVAVSTGERLADPLRRRRSLAVGPATSPPDAMRTGHSLVRLEPGKRFEARFGIAPEA